MIHSTGIIRFEPGYFERIWGGDRLSKLAGRTVSDKHPIGEAWLVSDHSSFTSVVADGPLQGVTLRELVEQDAVRLLGTRPKLTPDGRFPLLLKLLDSSEALSVQVHPDDAAAARLGEPDVGKTEMWHVLESRPDSVLICGLEPALTPEQFVQAVQTAALEPCMKQFKAAPGTTVFVNARVVHAMGGGILLAEIQQNSNLTYRIYDWGRVQENGQPRELHLDKALDVIAFGSPEGGPVEPLLYQADDAECQLLSACRYFAGERVQVAGRYSRINHGQTFHILLGVEGALTVQAGFEEAALEPGQALLIPGWVSQWRLEGAGTALDYYTPDLDADIVAPLQVQGHSIEAIRRIIHG